MYPSSCKIKKTQPPQNRPLSMEVKSKKTYETQNYFNSIVPKQLIFRSFHNVNGRSSRLVTGIYYDYNITFRTIIGEGEVVWEF